MECKDIELFVSDYIENRLDKDKRREFENHLFECEKCRIFVEEIRELTNDLIYLKKGTNFIQKNRLYVIFDNNMEKEEEKNNKVLTWIILTAATIILVFNLFYFTNLIPSMNKITHILVSKIEKTAVRTISYIKMFTNPEDFAYMIRKNNNNLNNKKKKGGKNG